MLLLLVLIQRAVLKFQKVKKNSKEIPRILKLVVVQPAKTSAKSLQLSQQIWKLQNNKILKQKKAINLLLNRYQITQ